jgi:hypothetical protein
MADNIKTKADSALEVSARAIWCRKYCAEAIENSKIGLKKWWYLRLLAQSKELAGADEGKRELAI